MTLHELTDDQIDRMVAERLEPLNCIPPAGTFIHEADDFEYSPLLAWYSFDEYGIPPCWYPRQFTRDWSACGTLLEQIPQNSGVEITIPNESSHAVVKRGVLYQVTIDICIDKERAQFDGEGKTLQRAICEAWLLASEVKE